MSETAGILPAAPWLKSGPLPRLLAALDTDGEQARMVGGVVRNALLGEPIGDIDIATTALPEEVVRRAKAAGFKPVPTGIDHGTITVVVDGRPFEVTTLRRDTETDGRRAKVAFGRDWKVDAERRDFTMNALSADRDGKIFDPVGGLADLRARRVRFIGEPARRIEEDYLRILRFFRFHAWYGAGELDQAGVAACIAGRDGIDRLSRERLRAEMLKLLAAPRALDALTTMSEAGLLLRVIASVPNLVHLAHLIAIEAALDLPADAIRRLGALAVTIVEDADRLRERLRLANSEYDRLTALAEDWWRGPPPTTNRARELLYRAGAENFADLSLVGFARSQAAANDATWRDFVTLPQRWDIPVFPLKAADLISRGVGKGPALGAALAAAERAWIAGGFPADDHALARIAQDAAHG